MTQKYHRSTYRAAFALAAAATLLLTSRADAQMLGQNIFGGTNTAATSLSTTSGTNGPVGPGFNGIISLSVGVGDTITETINAGNNATFTAGTSGIAGLFGNFSASKPITATFVPNQAYSFTLTSTTNAELNLLSGLDVTFSTVKNGTSTTVYDAANGSGLLGIAQVLNLFGGGNTGTFSFTAPAGVDTSVPITVTVSGQLAIAALNNTFTLSGATLTAVPEPGTVGAMGVGIAALATLRFRRRLSRN